MSDFDSSKFHFRGKGVSTTVTTETTGNLDYKMPADRWVNGICVILKDHVNGDKMSFQIVDVDNILGGGAGTVLNTFAEDWYVYSDAEVQGVIKIEYAAEVLKDLYIRVKYTSTGGTDVKIKANLFLHEKD